jgi:hypothetical protein
MAASTVSLIAAAASALAELEPEIRDAIIGLIHLFHKAKPSDPGITTTDPNAKPASPNAGATAQPSAKEAS